MEKNKPAPLPDPWELPRLKPPTKKRNGRYTGLLAKPMQSDFWGGPEEGQLWLRTSILALELGVDQSDGEFWLKMFLALATRHVPGFQVAASPPKKKGNRKAVSGPVGILGPVVGSEEALRFAVEKLMNEKHLSVVASCTALAKQRGGPFSAPSRTIPDKHRKTLQRRYWAQVKRVRNQSQ